MSENDIMIRPKEAHESALDNVKQTMLKINAILDDAKTTKLIESKNVLIDFAKSQFALILDDIAIANKAEKSMIVHPKASAAEVKTILKEVGLKDMDDPEYGKEYMIDDERAIDILENTFKQNKQANNAKTSAKKTRSKSSKVKLQDKT